MRISKVIPFYSRKTGITPVAMDFDLKPIIDELISGFPGITLESVLCYEYDTQTQVQWELNFFGIELGVSDIDHGFLDPLSLIFDMNHIDESFDHIAITHDRKTKIDHVKIIITFRN